MHPWHDVELPASIEEAVPVIVEIPTGSNVKFELDKVSGLLAVDRVLFSAVHYPANYGFVPRTYCDDGDPLDTLVYCQEPIEPLAIMRARVIGVMKMHDERGVDDKLFSVHADDPEFAQVNDIRDLPALRMRELQRFLLDYKALEPNKKVSVSEPKGRSEGLRVLTEAIQLYKRDRLRLLPRSGRAATQARPRRSRRRRSAH